MDYQQLGVVILFSVVCLSCMYVMSWNVVKQRTIANRRVADPLEKSLQSSVQGLSLDEAIPIVKSMAPGYSIKHVEMVYNQADGWTSPTSELLGANPPGKTIILHVLPASQNSKVQIVEVNL